MTMELAVAAGNRYQAGHKHLMHRHRRNQVLYASTGIMVMGTALGTWVVPRQRSIWIPAGIDHEIVMIGDVSSHSVYLQDGAVGKASDRCQVLGVSPLLCCLLAEAADLTVAYETDGRASHIMRLIILELRSTVELPLNVPIPVHVKLKARCRRFLAEPNASETIDDWAAGLAMSRRAFTRLFRNHTGMSLSGWRQHALVVTALPRLASGENVTRVALDCGYSSVGAFSTMFPLHKSGVKCHMLHSPALGPRLVLQGGNDCHTSTTVTARPSTKPS